MSSNSVFISYRRSVSGILALAVYQDLSYNGIDAFYDITSLDAGQFDTAILNQIAARPYFLPILTPGTLERCKEAGDWVLREIEEALRLNRMIVPLYTPEFNFDDMDKYLPPDIAHELRRYQAVEIPYKYFQYAMQDIRTRYLKPIDRPTTPTPENDVSVIGQKQALAQAQPQVPEAEFKAQEHLDKGIALRDAADHEGAIREYSEAIRLNPRLTEAYARRASRYSDLGNEAAAWHDLEDALRIDPNNSLAYIIRGNLRQAKGDSDGAIADYNQALKLNPQYASTYIVRGIARQALGDPDGAIADYNQALKLNPQYTLAYNNRGIARKAIGDLDGAIADYSQALKLNPQLAEAYGNRGLAYEKKGETKKAAADYQRVLELQPDHPDAKSMREVIKKYG